MSMDDRFTDEKLHLFIDGEIDSNDRAEIMEALHQDDALSSQVCELQKLKESVRLAYESPPSVLPHQSQFNLLDRSGTWLNAIAAVLVLAIGVAGGWFFSGQFNAQNSEAMNVVASDSGIGAAMAQQQPEKIILHISKSSPEQFIAALEYTEKFLSENNSSYQIDVVAHAGGLDVMRNDISPVRDKIVSLMNRYENVHFIACAGAIKMYQSANGKPPEIIRGVGTDSTAFDHIVNRLQGGDWRYIKVESPLEI